MPPLPTVQPSLRNLAEQAILSEPETTMEEFPRRHPSERIRIDTLIAQFEAKVSQILAVFESVSPVKPQIPDPGKLGDISPPLSLVARAQRQRSLLIAAPMGNDEARCLYIFSCLDDQTRSLMLPLVNHPIPGHSISSLYLEQSTMAPRPLAGYRPAVPESTETWLPRFKPVHLRCSDPSPNTLLLLHLAPLNIPSTKLSRRPKSPCKLGDHHGA